MKNVASIKIKRQNQINKYANNLLKRYSLKQGVKGISKAMQVYLNKIEKARKSTTLTYAKLEVFNYSDLKKMGYTNKAIYNKLNAYYRKEGRQLMLDKTDTKSMSKIIRKLKKGGKLISSRIIVKTERSKEKLAYKTLKQITNKLGDDNFAGRLLDDYQKGYINAYQLNASVSKFTSNAGNYFQENDLNKITYIVNDYNDELVM